MTQLGYSMANALTLDDVEERAAIREYDGGMTRAQAEGLTAKDCGFNSWREMVASLRNEK